jgi:aryl-alcohol dehydrogenase-like predicted oxidoreductase
MHRAGKIAHIGLSNVTEEQLREAQKLCPVVSVQNRYNLGDRHSEALIDVCAREQIAFLPWGPIRGADENEAAVEIAAHHRASPIQVVLAWLLARSPAMLPIAGTGSVRHFEENLQALGVALDDGERERLSAAA